MAKTAARGDTSREPALDLLARKMQHHEMDERGVQHSQRPLKRSDSPHNVVLLEVTHRERREVTFRMAVRVNDCETAAAGI